MHMGGRGTSAYLLWRATKPALVVDMGGDTPTALARAGVLPSQLAVLAISHMHPDHVSGLPDFFWGEMTARRSLPLKIIGPEAGDKFLSIDGLLDKLFSASGAFPDLASLVSGNEFRLNIRPTPGLRETVHDDMGLKIRALKVVHGRAPTIAYRVDVDGYVIVFAGDQTMSNPHFTEFASGADILVAHAIANRAVEGHALDKVVATPRSIGRTASEAKVGRLVLSHLIGTGPTTPDAQYWSLTHLPTVIADISEQFRGRVDVASDLVRYTLDPSR